MRPTDEQIAAIEARGKTIVSASAGSGKTFVMIEKLVNAVANGVDLDDILAVTFTKKAAAQMKEKLRSSIIKRIEGAGEEKPRLKAQLSKISSANISTIHSLCARLIRTYFYALDGVDSGFDIISSDDAVARDLKSRAADNLFERLYETDDKNFKLLLSCFMKKRNDASVKKLLWEAYDKLRSVAHYESVLKNAADIYTEDGFKSLSDSYFETLKNRIDHLICAVERFKEDFPATKKAAAYNALFEEMLCALKTYKTVGLFGAKPALTVSRKPVDAPEDKEAGASFKAFKDGINKKYAALCPDLESEEKEREYFIKSGGVATAFSDVLLQLDREYAAVKADENKLDYNDLEHLTLRLLADEVIKKEINSGFKYIYVDEYQDVNPVQEEIISSLSGETFLVGDVKQAIYGFRGSKSVFFTRKFENFKQGFGNALNLSSNFRSSDGVLNFVNTVFSEIMRPDTCGVDYAGCPMRAGGQYPEGYGEVKIHVFGKEEEEESELKVYSVLGSGQKTRHSREGLAVLEIVEKELCGTHYDLKAGKFVPTRLSDICILTRKNKGESVDGIVRTLTDRGYALSGAQEANICELSEVKQVLDILSLIDNAEQDVPLVTALLSPLGGFTEDELAKIRIAFQNEKSPLPFRKCCEKYLKLPGEISQKLSIFGGQLQKLRDLAEVLPAGELIDALLEEFGLECGLGAGGEAKVKNILRLREEGASLPLAAFLRKIKTGGYNVSSPAPAPSDSIKIMSMHASKGLEFPVVIVADVTKTFKGQDYEEVPFDEVAGFAPKAYDRENMLAKKTILRRVIKAKQDREDLFNELNLFYVACTRAMCNLHILAEEVKPFDGAVFDAKCYADLFDIAKFAPEPFGELSDVPATEYGGTMLYAPDEELVDSIESHFMQPYAHGESVDLPVKSSASAILRLRDDEPYEVPHVLFGGEGETGTERGTAYHRFLELCDFSVKTVEGVEDEKRNFLASGRITKAQFDLLKAEELSKILNMPVFADLGGATLYREREFLCRLKACDILDTLAEDHILVQGAIDLLAVGDFGVKIIDYKYSKKSDAQLVKTYAAQLDLYKKATATILGYAPEKISKTIVNIHTLRQIILE